MSTQFPPCPASLKSIQHYLKTAAEHDNRDPVVSYWCRLYSLQCGLKIDKKSDESKLLLSSLMDWLEAQKKALSDNEAITNDIAAQAHIENYALKLFLYADGQDRAANFGKNVVKAFYTAGMLFDVLQVFGELSEEILQNRKYAKWKAAYIHNCLKNGETPIPGPIPGGENELGGSDDGNNIEQGTGMNPLGFVEPPDINQPSNVPYFPSFPVDKPQITIPEADSNVSPTSAPVTPSNDALPAFMPSRPSTAIAGNSLGLSEGSNVVLKPDQITKAQKYCKWAASALNYDDIPTAVSNLQKALKLLQTGIDS